MRAKGKLSYLLMSLIVLLLLYPYLETGHKEAIALSIIFSGITFFGVYAVSSKPRHMYISLGLGIPWVILRWVDALRPIQANWILVLWYILMCTFFVYVSYIIMSHILRADEVTIDVISGAVSVYIFIGLFFFILHGTIETVWPGSYVTGALPEGADHITWSGFLYYSFSTLTTLGYGDISPLSSQARSIAIIEAIVGVFFVAVLIARLVAAHDWKAHGDIDKEL